MTELVCLYDKVRVTVLNFNNDFVVPKRKVKKITESGFIPGIYNYCDRWCERCELCLRCMSFAMGKRMEEKGEFDFDEEIGQEDESVWARLKNVFESTYDVLHELAEERGINIEDIYASENVDKEFWGEDFENPFQGERCDRLVESSDIIRMCMIYEDLGDKCMENIFGFIDDREKATENDPTDEALEVVSWYLDLIQTKMRRALYSYHYQTAGGQKLSEEYNGSAKVALMATERSIANWNVIIRYCILYEREISHLLVVLDQLRTDIEKQFPDARSFLRPGFECPVAGKESKKK